MSGLGLNANNKSSHNTTNIVQVQQSFLSGVLFFFFLMLQH